jgi:leucyl aminopeptidase
MELRVMPLALMAGLCLSLHASAGPLAKKTAWMTIGDAAFQQVRTVAPSMVSIASGELDTGATTEKVHAVALDEADLVTIAGAIHQRMQQCGGFMYHASEAEARSALRSQRFTPPRPAYALDNGDLVAPMLAQMQEKNIEVTILALSGFLNRYYSSQTGVDASNWLMQRWAGIASGREDISVHQFAHPAYRQPSVIVTIMGNGKPAEAVVVGAHLDSIAGFGTSDKSVAPGADDDASGVAGITEVLRVIVERGYKPRRTIHLIAYAAEEVGLRGSQEIARAFKQNSSKVVGVLQLDMTNYKGAANDIYLFTDYTDSEQNTFLAQLIGTYLPGLKIGYDKCGYACSDHASWSGLGYPTSMPFEATFARDNPYIHTSKDTYANSGNQAAHALKFARLAAAFVVELASH